MHHSHQHSMFCYLPWIVSAKFQASSSDNSCFGLQTDLNFFRKYLYTVHMLNSLSASLFPGLFYHQNYAVHHFILLTVHASLSLVKTKRQDHDCLHGLIVGISMSPPKISVSQSSDISEYVSTYNSDTVSFFS
jgi:hypothetical protein